MDKTEAGRVSQASRPGPNLLDLHRVIAEEGLEAARQRAATKGERASVQAAGAMLAMPKAEDDRVYGSLFVIGLPHKSVDRTVDPRHWHHESRNATLTLAGSELAGATSVGIPFGSKARLILLYLQSEAMRRNSPVIELGSSMYSWLRAMSNQSVGGMTYRMFVEQLRRISACRMSMVWKDASEACEAGTFLERLPVTDTALHAGQTAGAAAPLAEEPEGGDWTFPERVVLSDVFFRSLQTHPLFQVRRSALRQISNNSVAIDLYILLSRRLSGLDAAEVVPWPSVAARFGTSYQRFRQMKPRYVDALRLALAVYPEARVEVTSEGLILHPSAPPLPEFVAQP